jgi:hypothetical protein
MNQSNLKSLTDKLDQSRIKPITDYTMDKTTSFLSKDSSNSNYSILFDSDKYTINKPLQEKYLASTFKRYVPGKRDKKADQSEIYHIGLLNDRTNQKNPESLGFLEQRLFERAKSKVEDPINDERLKINEEGAATSRYNSESLPSDKQKIALSLHPSKNQDIKRRQQLQAKADDTLFGRVHKDIRYRHDKFTGREQLIKHTKFNPLKFERKTLDNSMLTRSELKDKDIKDKEVLNVLNSTNPYMDERIVNYINPTMERFTRLKPPTPNVSDIATIPISTEQRNKRLPNVMNRLDSKQKENDVEAIEYMNWQDKSRIKTKKELKRNTEPHDKSIDLNPSNSEFFHEYKRNEKESAFHVLKQRENGPGPHDSFIDLNPSDLGFFYEYKRGKNEPSFYMFKQRENGLQNKFEKVEIDTLKDGDLINQNLRNHTKFHKIKPLEIIEFNEIEPEVVTLAYEQSLNIPQLRRRFSRQNTLNVRNLEINGENIKETQIDNMLPSKGDKNARKTLSESSAIKTVFEEENPIKEVTNSFIPVISKDSRIKMKKPVLETLKEEFDNNNIELVLPQRFNTETRPCREQDMESEGRQRLKTKIFKNKNRRQQTINRLTSL